MLHKLGIKSALAASALLTLLAYWNGLTGPLIFDDIHNLEPLRRWLAGETGVWSVIFGNESGLLRRPVAMASFAMNGMSTGMDVRALKLTNLALHLGNGLLVFWLLRLIAANGGLGAAAGERALRWLPWFGATIWLIHPLFASTVLYVIQRMAILSAFFTLLAIICYFKARVYSSAGLVRAATWAAAVLIFTCLATLSKENGILALSLCATLELTLFLRVETQPRRRRASLLFVSAFLLIPAVAALLAVVSNHPIVMAGYDNRSFDLVDRLLTQPRALWDYVGSLVFPTGRSLGIYQDAFQASYSFFSPSTTWISLVAWAVTLAASWKLRNVVPGFAAGVAFFLVGHALESSIFPLLMYFEHRNYLPAVGAIWAILSLVHWAAGRMEHAFNHPTIVWNSAGVLVLTALFTVTLAQSVVWSSKPNLLLNGLNTQPDSRWLRADLIAFTMEQKPPAVAAARQHAEALLASSDPSTRQLGAVSGLMIECASGGAADKALIESAQGTESGPIEADLLRAWESLADGLRTSPCKGLDLKEFGDRLESMLDASALEPDWQSIWRLRFKLAQIRFDSRAIEQALEQARIAWQSGSADPQVGVFISELLIEQGKLEEAAAMLDQAKERIAADDLVGQEVVAQLRLLLEQESAKLQH